MVDTYVAARLLFRQEEVNLEKRGDVCSCIISAVGLGSKQLFNSFSEKCRTPE